MWYQPLVAEVHQELKVAEEISSKDEKSHRGQQESPCELPALGAHSARTAAQTRKVAAWPDVLFISRGPSSSQIYHLAACSLCCHQCERFAVGWLYFCIKQLAHFYKIKVVDFLPTTPRIKHNILHVTVSCFLSLFSLTLYLIIFAYFLTMYPIHSVYFLTVYYILYVYFLTVYPNFLYNLQQCTIFSLSFF